MILQVFDTKFRLRCQCSYMDQVVEIEREGRDQFTRRVLVLRLTLYKFNSTLIFIQYCNLVFYVEKTPSQWARKSCNQTMFVGLLPQNSVLRKEQKKQRDFRPAVCSGLPLCYTLHRVKLSNQKTIGLQHDRADRCVSVRPIPAQSTPSRVCNELQQDGSCWDQLKRG